TPTHSPMRSDGTFFQRSTRLRYSFSSSPFLVPVCSFPTRRSSDLLEQGVSLPDQTIDALLYALEASEVNTVLTAGQVRAAVQLRSEEHSSELQSREKLVCRLLLDKKKPLFAQMASVPLSKPGISTD